MARYRMTVMFTGDEDELDYLCEGVEQAGGHVLTTVIDDEGRNHGWEYY